jgi:ketosteroid isomerase-like protein
MSTDNATLIRDGFDAFMRGDFDALRELMDPDAQWLWWEPIPGDCHDRDKIIATLRDRHEEGVVTGLNEIVEGSEKLLGEITDGRPGPSAEMRLEDPDGYVLIVAQLESSQPADDDGD